MYTSSSRWGTGDEAVDNDVLVRRLGVFLLNRNDDRVS